MTVAELIEHLQSLPLSALTAQVVIGHIDMDEDHVTSDILSVEYDRGEVVLDSEEPD